MMTNDPTIGKYECEKVRPAESHSGGSESEAAGARNTGATRGYPVYNSLAKQNLKEPINVRI